MNGSAGMPAPLTSQGETVGEVWTLFLLLAVGVFAFVLALLLFVVVRYRRRDDRLPGQSQYNVPLEVVYTAVPLLTLIALFVVTERTISSIEDDSVEPDLEVEVLGFQWQWQFTYLDDATTNGTDGATAAAVVVGDQPIGDSDSTEPQPYPVLVLPEGATVRFTLESADVIHSFWFPGFLYKEDAIPGTTNTFDIDVTGEPGTYVGGMCAEFCGAYHARMGFDVEILPAEEFDAWLAAAGEDP